MKVQLTKRLIEAAKPQAKPYELRDVQVRGLLLRVQPSGHKAFVCEWTRGQRRTLGSPDHLTLEQARAHATTTVAEFVQSGLPRLGKARTPSQTLRQFLDDRYALWALSARKSGKSSVERIRAAFPRALESQLSELDTGYIDRWWTERLTTSNRLGELVTKATAARDVAALRSALSKAVEWKMLARNPLLDLRKMGAESRKVVRSLSPSEESSIRAELKERDARLVLRRESGNEWRAARGRVLLPSLSADDYADHLTPIVLVAMNTGLRRGELLSLKWTDVDLPRQMLTIRAVEAKSGRQRHVPLNTEAAEALTRWSRQSVGPLVFQPKDVKSAWSSLLNKAGIAEFRFHDLRHHFASRLVTRGVDLNTVRELLGHGDIKMTLRYSHLSPDHLAAAVAKMSHAVAESV